MSCVTDGVTSASLEESANLAITVTADVSCFPVKNPRGEPGSVITECDLGLVFLKVYSEVLLDHKNSLKSVK